MPVGALLGKVGNSAPFAIGMQTQPLVMPASGRLMLGVNDNELSDNSGFFLGRRGKTIERPEFGIQNLGGIHAGIWGIRNSLQFVNSLILNS